MKKRIFIAFLLLLLMVLAHSVVQADLRSDTMSLLAKLRHEGIADKLPDEMRSLDATVATAEMYYQLNDTKNANRYYLLASQKGTLILQKLQQPAALGAATAPTVVPQSAAVSVPSVSKSVPPQQQEPQPVLEKTQSIPQHPESSGDQSDIPEQTADIVTDQMVGTVGTYTVGKKDTLRLVAGKLGVSRAQLISLNKLDAKGTIKEGQLLKYNNRRIIPQQTKDGIVINIPDRMLYYFQKGKLQFSTAVALGTPGKTGKFVWHTPSGKFKIVSREKDPTWTVPPSIQEEMRLEGKEVITSIPPGPGNPLGKYALKTSLPGILIHSTNKPWSIYTYASHGCIRVHPDQMSELFNMIKVSTPGEIIYRPVKLAATPEGRIFLEVHGDIYSKTKGAEDDVRTQLKTHKLENKVDWEKVKKVISRKSGVAEEITLETVEAQKEMPVIRQQSQSPS